MKSERPEDGEQQRREHAQTYPCGIYVEVVCQTGAYAAQLAVLHVAVESARDARIAVVVGRRGLILGVFVILVYLRCRAQLLDYVLDERAGDDGAGGLCREYQLGDAGLDVGDDLLARRVVLVGVVERLDVCVERVIGVVFERERYAGYAAFLDFIHNGSGFMLC